MWQATRKLSLKKLLRLFASSWSMLMAVTFSQRLMRLSAQWPTWRKARSGQYSTRWWWACTPYTGRRSCTETSNARTSSWRSKALWNWATSTWARLQRTMSWRRKRVRLIMLRQKFGKTNRMTSRLIFGRSEQCFMRWLPWVPHSRRRTWKACTIEWSKEFTQRYLVSTLLTYRAWLRRFWSWIQRNDPLLSKFFTCPSLSQSTTRASEIVPDLSDRSQQISLARSRSPETYLFWLNAYLQVSMKLTNKLKRQPWKFMTVTHWAELLKRKITESPSNHSKKSTPPWNKIDPWKSIHHRVEAT